uniref:Uncharacterized protein n=1 Tax=candidate division WOR-3 bacterium TaxID=2052148 RepID=A0A7C4CBG9_UNCW3
MGRVKSCLRAAVAAVLFPSITIATISAGVETDVNSRYVWRGLVQDKRPVIQPSAWGSVGNLEVNVWSNWPTSVEAGAAGPNELDFTATYSTAWAGTDIEPAAAVFWFPGQAEAPATAELSLRVSRPVGPVAVFSEHSLDVWDYSGAYFGNVGAAFEHEVSPALMTTVSASAGWGSPRFNTSYVGPTRWALNVVEVGAEVTWQVLPFLYLRPHFGASALVDPELRTAAEKPAGLVVGLALGSGFQP